MSSQINTNGIDTNFPVPGVNNSTQGFRNNFSQVRNNLNVAATEITDLQSKVLLKSALTGTNLDNDMQGASIANCLTRGFRESTFNLGNDLAGIVTVNVNRADVQVGTVSGNVSLQFGGWAPIDTGSSVILRLSKEPNTNPVISLPAECISTNNDFGVTVLENYQDVSGTATFTFPADVETLELRFYTLDCGDTIQVTPINRSQQAAQIITRPVPPTGLPGDVLGKVAVDENFVYVCTGSFDSTIVEKSFTATNATGNLVTLVNTSGLALDIPVIFSDNIGGIEAGKVYYVKSIVGSDITVSATRVAGDAGPTFTLTTENGAGIATFFIGGTDIWKRVAIGSW